MLAFGDASWANASKSLSQAGFILFLADLVVFTAAGGWVSPQDRRSHRVKGVCRSTLAAECMAMDASEVKPYANLCGLFAISAEENSKLRKADLLGAFKRAAKSSPPSFD